MEGPEGGVGDGGHQTSEREGKGDPEEQSKKEEKTQLTTDHRSRATGL